MSFIQKAGALLASFAFVVASLTGSSVSAQGTQPPGFSIAFSPSTIAAGSTSAMTFTIDNTVADNAQITTMDFSTALPANLFVAAIPNTSTTCTSRTAGSATITAAGGGTTIALSDAILAPNAVCSVVVEVTSSTPGTITVPAETLNTSSGSSNSSPVDLIVSGGLPTFSKSFSPSTVFPSEVSTLTYTIDNTANASVIGNLDFTDTLPAGIRVAATPDASSDCVAASGPNTTVTATAGSGSIVLDANGSTFFAGFEVLAAGATCTVTVDVEGITIGDNVSTSGPLFVDFTSTSTASATLTVADPGEVLVTKAVSVTPVNAGSVTELTYTIQNLSRTLAVSDLAFQDSLVPDAGVLATFGNATTNTCSATATGSGSLADVSGGSLGTEATCIITFPITAGAGSAGGVVTTTSGTGLTFTKDGSGDTATIPTTQFTVTPATETAPTVGLAFSPDFGSPGDDVSLIFTITNTSTNPISDLALSTELLTIFPTSPSAPSSTCGATPSFTPLFNPPPPSSVSPANVSMSGGSLAASGSAGDSCTVTVPLTISSTAAANVYSQPSGNVTATVGGAAKTAAEVSAGITVGGGAGGFANLRFAKEFVPSSIASGDAMVLRYFLESDAGSTAEATAVAFTDDLTAFTGGVTGATASGLPITGVCGEGTISGTAGDTEINLTGVTLSIGEICTFDVNITGATTTTTGDKVSTSEPLTATAGGASISKPGAEATLTMGVDGSTPPTMTKSFSPSPALPGQTAELTYTFTNPNTATGADFVFFQDAIDSELSGLVTVGAPTTNDCSLPMAGTASTIQITSGTIPPGPGICTLVFDVDVPGSATTGDYTSAPNSFFTSLGTSTPTNGTLSVNAEPILMTMAFVNSPVQPGNTAEFDLVFENFNSAAASAIGLTIDLDSVLPGALLSSAAVGSEPLCTASSAGTGTGVITISGLAVAGSGTCGIRYLITVPSGATDNSYTFATSAFTGTMNSVSINGDAASDSLVVSSLVLPTFAKAFSPTSGVPDAATTLTYTIANTATGAGDISGLTFSEDLSGLTIGSLPSAPCGSGSALTAVGSSLTLTGGNLIGGESCIIPVPLTVPTAAPVATITLPVTAVTDSGSNRATSGTAAFTVLPPAADLSVTVSDSADPVVSGASLTYTVQVSNAGPNDAASVVSTFTAPANFTVTSTSGCAEDPSGTPTCTLGTITNGGNASYTVTGTVGGNDVAMSAQAVVSSATGDPVSGNNTGTQTTTYTPRSTLSVSKVVNRTTAVAGESIVYTITAGNSGPNTDPAASVADTFSSDLSCGYTSVASGGASGNTAAGAGNLSETLSLPVGGLVTYTATCQIGVSFTGNVNNTASITPSITDTAGPTAKTSSAPAVTVSAPALLTIAKAFNLATINQGQTSTLTYTLGNTNSYNVTSVAFSDTFPAGLEIAAAPALSDGCGSTFAPSATNTSISYSGGTVNASDSCVISVDVRATASGSLASTTSAVTSILPTSTPGAAGALTSTEVPVVWTNSLTPNAVNQGETSTLQINISNAAGSIDVIEIGFTDTFDTGLVVATPVTQTNTCGGTFAPTAGDGSINLASGALEVGGSCAITLLLDTTASGTLTAQTGTLSSSLATDVAAISTSLTATEVPLTFAQSFTPSTINQGQTSSLVFDIGNVNGAIDVTNIGFSFALPLGLSVTASNNTCSGILDTGVSIPTDVAAAPVPGSTVLELQSGALTAGQTCSVTITVRGDEAGTYPTGSASLSSSLAGLTPGTSGTLTVTEVPLVFSQSFTPNALDQGETTTHLFGIDNSGGSIDVTAVGFTYELPTGLSITGTTNSCNGTFAETGTTATGVTMALSGGDVTAGNSCSVSLQVRALESGSFSVTTSALSSSLASDTAATTAGLTVTEIPLVFAQSFTPNAIDQGETTTHLFSVDNSAASIDTTDVAFSYELPTGLSITSTTNTCNGTFDVAGTTATGTTMALAAGTITAGGSCSVSMQVRALESGSFPITSSVLSSSLASDTSATSATLTATEIPLVFTQSFTPNALDQGETTTHLFGIDNSGGSIDVTLLAFSYELPTGLSITSTTNTCNGTFAQTGTTLTGTTLALTGGDVTAGNTCSVSMQVRALESGSFSVTTAVLGSSLASDTAPTSATLTATEVPLTFAQSFTPASIDQGQLSVQLFEIDNTGGSIDVTDVAFSYELPTGLSVSSSNSTCGGTFAETGTTATGATMDLVGGAITAGANCSVTVNVSGLVAGGYSVTTSAVSSSLASETAATTAALTVVEVPLLFTQTFTPDSVDQGASSTLAFSIDNSAGSIDVTALAFSNDFPTGLEIVDGTTPTNSCNGTLDASATATAANAGFQLTGGTVDAGATCTVSYTVRPVTDGSFSNVSSPLRSSLASDVAATTASLTSVEVPMTWNMAFAPASIAQGDISTLTVNIDNSAGSIDVTSMGFTGTLPSDVQVASSSAASSTCNGTFTAASGTTALTLAAGTIDAGATCAITVPVQGLTVGSGTATTGVLASSLTTDTAALSAGISVSAQPLNVVMSFAPASIEQFETSRLTYTLTNPSGIAASAVTLTDTLPGNVFLDVNPAATTTCSGGTLTATASGSAVTLTGATIPASSSCTVSAIVTSLVIGNYPSSTDSVTSSLGTSTAATASLEVTRATTGTVAFVQNTDVDGTYSFASSEAALTTSLTASGGTGTVGPIKVTEGSHSVTSSQPTGVVLTAISCNDGDSTGDWKTGVTTLNIAAQENVICTYTSGSSVQKTIDTINSFLTKRADLILSSEPSMGRRIDRLNRGFGNASPLTFSNGDLKSMLPFTADVNQSSYAFSTSLLQVRQAAASVQLAHGSTKDAVYVDNYRFDAWFEAQYKKFDAGTDGEGNFGVAHFGMDYLLNQNVLIGAMVTLDTMDDENLAANSSASGHGWMAGPYITARLAPNLYFDARVAGGESTNKVSPFNTYTDEFGTQRWMATASLSGDFQRGKWNIRPNASLAYFTETQDSYVDSVGSVIPSQTIELGQLKIGPTFTGRFEGDNGEIFSPYLSVDAIYNIGQTSGVTLTNGPTASTDGWRGRLKAGVNVKTEDGLELGFGTTYDGLFRSDFDAWGLSFDFSIPLKIAKAR